MTIAQTFDLPARLSFGEARLKAAETHLRAQFRDNDETSRLADLPHLHDRRVKVGDVLQDEASEHAIKALLFEREELDQVEGNKPHVVGPSASRWPWQSFPERSRTPSPRRLLPPDGGCPSRPAADVGDA